MTLTQLSYFREIVRMKSFTKAANKLFITQSTLSKSIHALEEEYQVTFIKRGSKQFELTKEGFLLFEYAENILNYYEAQISEFEESLHQSNNILRIGIPPTAGTIYCNEAIAKMQSMYPEINLEILQWTSKKIVDAVLEGDLDIGFILDTFEDERLEKKSAISTEAVLVVPKNHRWAKRKYINFNEIKEEKIMMVTPEYTYYNLVIDKCHEAGFDPEFSFESSEWDFIFELVTQGQGVTIFPKLLINKFNKSRVKCIHLENPEFGWHLIAIRLKNNPKTEAIKRFWSILDK